MIKKILPYLTGINILIAIVLINIALSTFTNLQLDLTKTKLHSLSPISKEVVRNLDDIVRVKVFVTNDLPSEIKPISNNLKTILNEVERINPGKLIVEYKDPNTDEESRKEAVNLGIQPLQFSSIKDDKFEVQSGYFGMALFYGDKKLVLPVAGDVGNLEYYLISSIKKLLQENEKVVGIAELNYFGQSQIEYLRRLMQREYKTQDINLNGDDLPDNVDSLLIVGDPGKLSDKAASYLQNWVNNKKGLIALIDGVKVDNNLVATKQNDSTVANIFKSNGMEIQPKLIVDESSGFANFRTQNGSFLTQYPYWVQVRPENVNSSLPPMSGITSLTLAWGSPLIVSGDSKPLFTSSRRSYNDETLNDLTPAVKYDFNSKELKTDVMGAINTSDKKLAIIGDSDFIKDQYVVNNQQNLIATLNIVDYFVQDSSLLEIRSKGVRTYPIRDISKQQKEMIKYANIVTPILLLGITITLFSVKRKQNNAKWNED